jgi:ABC-type multidrug transport system ATPase subunit
MKSSAYVMQDNVHIGCLTVRESMMYAARLRLSEKMSKKSRDKQIQKVMDMLGLSEVADTVVGDENTRGISGGQCKRLSIGVEIISLPDLIFLDEPTTGLDSSISYEVMSAVRNLANQNRTVICTIHQPSPMTYMLFDKLMLLGKGKVIYFGPARDIVNYFASSPYKFPYKTGSNPADYLIAVGGGFLPASSGKVIPAEELANFYASGELYKLFMENIDTMITMDLAAVGPPPANADADKSDEYNTSIMNQIYVLCDRVIVTTIKQRRPTVTTFFRHFVMSLFYGTIFYQLKGGTSSSCYTNRLSLIFFCLMFMVLGHQQAIPQLFEARLVFYRERGARAYGALPYWFSSWFLQVPLILLNVLVFSALVYSLCGLKDGGYGYFFIVLYMTSLTGLFMAQLIASMAPTAQSAISLFPVALFFSVAFAGYIVYIPQFDQWLRVWAPYGSFMRWAFQGLVLNEFDGNNDLPYENEYIDNLGFDTYTKEQCAPIIIIFTAIFCWFLLLALKFINFEER